jgi:hemerythrin
MLTNNLYIVWSKQNETGIPIIDEQHRAIVSTINSLFYFIQDGHAMDVLRPTLTLLAQYTKIHFSTEEALLRKAGYEDFDNHVELHHALVKRTVEVTQESINEKNPSLLLGFLKDWWIHHINEEDREYVVTLKRHLKLDN